MLRSYKRKTSTPNRVLYPPVVMKAFQEASKVHVLQIKEEFLDFLKLLLDYKVKSVLEIGAYQGGTTRAFLAMGMKVVSIDKDPQEELFQIINDPKFTLIKENSQDHLLRDKVADVFGEQKFDLVCIDGDHSEMACETDFIYYSPLAKKLIAFHDITPTERHPDVARVWGRLKSKFHKSYEITHPSSYGGHGWGVIEI